MVRRLFLASLIAATACTFPEQPLPAGARQVVVHAILDPSQRYQLVRLSITDGSQVSQGELDDAAVSITTPEGRKLLARQDSLRDSTGKAHGALPDYRIDLQAAGVSLAAGASYQLRIVMRNGEVITGETKIPSATPGPMPPATEFSRLRDTLRLSWNRVGGARAYEAQVWATQSYAYNGTTYSYTNLEYTAFVDTALTLAGTAKSWDDNEVFPPAYGGYSVTARVHIYAVDDNYYEYYRLLGDPFIGAAPGHLNGGLGVFGAIVPVVQRQLTLK